MQKSDFQAFSSMLDSVCRLLSRGNYVPDAHNTALFFRALQSFDITTVRAAFDAHVSDPIRGRFPPVPADLLAQIEGAAAADGRPGEEEAWSLALMSRDEAATVIWTQEVAEAFGEVRGVLSTGDKIGARMAFKEVYAKLVAQARGAHRPLVWQASIGSNPTLARNALTVAAAKGRIPSGGNAADVLALPAPTTTPLLLAAPDESAGPDDLPSELRAERIAQLKRLRTLLTTRPRPPSARELQAHADRERTQTLKSTAAQKVAAFTAHNTPTQLAEETNT